MHKRLCNVFSTEQAMTAATRVTLNDVATAAGVSVSTASRSLNGQAEAYRISEETATTVRAAAERLGFRPSRLARSLRLQKTGLIGIVVPDVSNPFFSAIAREVTLATEAAGYSVLLADSREETEREAKLLSELIAREVEAIVVCPVGVEQEHLKQAEQSGATMVLVDRTFPSSDFLQVTSKHEAGAQKAMRLLTAQGHRQIGVLQGLPGTLPNEARLCGVRDALERVGESLNPDFIRGDNFTAESGYASASQLLDEHPKLTALFAFSMPNAFGALRAATEAGRSVPDDLSIVAFDDSPFADLMQVPISTVAQDVESLGQRAAELILKQLQGGRASRKRLHEIGVDVRHRDSIGKPPR